MSRTNPLPADVADLLAYDSETGELRWRVSRGRMSAGEIAGTPADAGSIAVRVHGTRYRAHRLAWLIYYGEDPSFDIDHRDGCRANNAITNLRPASIAENSRNRKRAKNNTSGVPGVCWNKDAGKWQADIQVNMKRIRLGRFDKLEDAAAAYRAAAEFHHGEFAAHKRPRAAA